MDRMFIHKATIIVRYVFTCLPALLLLAYAVSLLTETVAYDWLLGGVSSCERRLNWKPGDKSSDGRLLIQ